MRVGILPSAGAPNPRFQRRLGELVPAELVAGLYLQSAHTRSFDGIKNSFVNWEWLDSNSSSICPPTTESRDNNHTKIPLMANFRKEHYLTFFLYNIKIYYYIPYINYMKRNSRHFLKPPIFKTIQRNLKDSYKLKKS